MASQKHHSLKLWIFLSEDFSNRFGIPSGLLRQNQLPTWNALFDVYGFTALELAVSAWMNQFPVPLPPGGNPRGCWSFLSDPDVLGFVGRANDILHDVYCYSMREDSDPEATCDCAAGARFIGDPVRIETARRVAIRAQDDSAREAAWAARKILSATNGGENDKQ